MTSRGRVLIIAGSDSGGGAGIQADIKTVTVLGGYAATAVTAVTVQNTLGVSAVHPIPTDIVLAQARAVLDDIGADAIKTGMLGDPARPPGGPLDSQRPGGGGADRPGGADHRRPAPRRRRAADPWRPRRADEG